MDLSLQLKDVERSRNWKWNLTVTDIRIYISLIPHWSQYGKSWIIYRSHYIFPSYILKKPSHVPLVYGGGCKVGNPIRI